MSYSQIKALLLSYKDSSDTARFFKKSEDQFLGISTPILRKIAQEYKKAFPMSDFLTSPINEERLLALFVLNSQFKKDPETTFNFYLKNLKWVNNWNLVDSSAHIILGAYLVDKPRDLLITLAQSKNLWERRIAVVATWCFIRKKDFEWTFKIVSLLLNDKEDLIHKASGWMLREVMKYGGEKELRNFLLTYNASIPRTTLRYAIERFEKEERSYLLISFRSSK